ncbi:hypothetical protein L1049_023597 [Liquidambar formosana]|uniref:Uncharacterized protein n=1 Tax=Liquidambar formosana TaxID=63359 RepID=A0AAP0X459_LIQFO
MRNSNLMPDADTKNLLVKSLWKEGKRREAAAVEERCEDINDSLAVALCGHIWTTLCTPTTPLGRRRKLGESFKSKLEIRAS